MNTTRRDFLSTLATISAAASLPVLGQKKSSYPYPIACNSYNWITFYGRQNKSWGEDLDACFADLVKTGIPAYEPSFTEAAGVQKIVPFLKKYSILMPSVYVNSLLHKSSEAEKSIASVLSIADEVRKLGTKIIVTNPSPISWGGNELKNDDELIEQAKNLEKLGNELRKRGLTLAYHTHDMEMKAGAREFHHVMLNTTPQNVAFCFDVHWMYRGSSNSQVAVFDVLKLYGSRIVELHIRQSKEGIWTESFGEGDIDYRRLAEGLKARKLRPHLVIEQCVEAKTPNTLDGVKAHIQDLAAVKDIFKPILG